MSISPALRDYADSWRCELPASPYQKGYEDCRYNRVYCNSFDIGSPEWRAYNRGNEDARKGTQH